ncbi:hypothetical protein GCM10010446_60700 [Streptomyces enissocaesilis]|uniref:NADP-dependent oxidoreductase domain-containing protein n=1 Tax=Streptomyces enissocaesilis TaxID=332589 RepID=A0ABN3XPH1_9ACTN
MTSISTPSHEATATGAPRPAGPGLLAGRTVSRLGYGALQLERLHGDRSAALALLRRAVELGIDPIDTAQFYGNGFVNGLILEAIGPEDGFLVASKVGAAPTQADRARCAPPNGPKNFGRALRPTSPVSASTGSGW